MEELRLTELTCSDQILNGPVRRRRIGSLIPLTAVQRRTWNSLMLEGKPLSHRMCICAVHVIGHLDVEVLRRAIESLIVRHESLRTRIIMFDGVASQCVDVPVAYKLNCVDLSTPPEPELSLQDLVQWFLDQKVDLSTEPLFEARLWKLSVQQYVLALVIDHIVSDGVSNGILARELWTLYEHGIQGRPCPLPELPVQFADYAVWQSETETAWLEKHEAYWMARLRGVRRLEVPCDAGLEEVKNPIGSMEHIAFGEALSARLRRVARKERTLLSLIVLTGYTIVIANWCRCDDVLIPFLSNGRFRRPELQNVVGYIVTVLHFRITIKSDDTFRSVLDRIQSEFSSVLLHEDFDRVPDLIPDCQSEAVFNWQPTYWKGGRLDHHVLLEYASELSRGRFLPQSNVGDQLRVEPFAARSSGAVKFGSVIFDTAAGLLMAVFYRMDRLSSRTIKHFCRNLLFALEEFAVDPSAHVTTVVAGMHWGRERE